MCVEEALSKQRKRHVEFSIQRELQIVVPSREPPGLTSDVSGSFELNFHVGSGSSGI